MYLDTASSEPLHPAARDAMLAALDRGYADPRRLHGSARDARLILDNAREAVAGALGVRRDEVSFTSSGTDAVHRGLLGLARPGVAVAHAAVEHSAVLHALAWRPDLQLRPVRVDHLGRVDLADLGEPDVLALQSANHEVGTCQPVAEAAGGSRLVFTDACASMGRLPLPDGWSVAAGSAHKWGGPAGVGVLLVRKGTPWRNPFPPDDRVDERVAGFENVPAVLGAAAALQAVVAERDDVNARQHALVDRIRARVSTIPDTEVVGDPADRLPHLVTFSFLYVDGEAIVDALNRRGFEVASGSACTASTLEPSHVLAAMGVLTHGNVRVSLTRDASEAEVDAFCDVLPDVVVEIRKDAGM
ncbi:MAG: cysteine desulfurase [Nocardioidaceae bacterium]|nr:cysteine desulfurase [Nocardioidaceae bacterium]